MGSSTKLKICSHNVNDFNHSKNLLYSRCEENPDSLWAIQEHWLAPPFKKQLGVNKLRCLHPNFDGYGTSAMGKEVESRVRTGRPFGGTGFLYNKKHSACVKPLVNYKHDCVSVVNLSTNIGNIILINGYLPYLNRRELQNYRVMYQETIAFISNK